MPLTEKLRSITIDKWDRYWNSKTPYKKAMFFYKILDILATSVGMPFFHSKNANSFTIFSYAAGIVFYICCFYTVAINIMNNRFDKACYPLCTLGALTLVSGAQFTISSNDISRIQGIIFHSIASSREICNLFSKNYVMS